MRIAVASGKGGTGKTTVSVNLFHYLNNWTGIKTLLIDCDVEEPNASFFIKQKQLKYERPVYRLVPEIDTLTCTFCKKCSDWCSFNALTIISSQKIAEVHEDLCHSCGACLVACNENAITEHSSLLGRLSCYAVEPNSEFIEGRLNIGCSFQTLLIKHVKEEVPNEYSIILFDAPPGTSCPVVQTIAETDYVIVVTEPTPFGLHDLKLTIKVIKQLSIPFGVIINKAGYGTTEVKEYLKLNQIRLLGEIPFSKEYAQAYSNGDILNDISPEILTIYRQIANEILTFA